MPEALYEPLFARLRASANVVPVVEAAAVIGRQIDRGLLGSVVDLSDDEVDDVIDELEDALVLEPWGTDGWRFRHELLREVAAELAPPSVRRGLHAKVADALVGGVGGEPDWRLVAGHYQQAERFDEAASAYQHASSGCAASRRAGRGPQLSDPGPHPARPRSHRARTVTAARSLCALERGFLTSAAEGYQSRAAAADFERCLQLGGTDLRDDELFATLTALAGYYITRADLRRAAQVLESLRAGLEEGRQWFRPVIEALFGAVAWLRGDFDAARSHLEAATADLAAADQHKLDADVVPAQRPDRVGHLHLALIRLVRGDLTGAEAELAHAARRAEQLGFPQGPYILAYTRCMEMLDAHRGRPARPCRGPGRRPERAGRAARLRHVAAGGGHPAGRRRRPGRTRRRRRRPDRPPAHIATLTTLLDTLRTVGVNIYITLFDAVLGRLLIAAGQPEAARERLDTALAAGPGHRNVLLRRRTVAASRPHPRRPRRTPSRHHRRPRPRPPPRRDLFELRAALDDFELHGHPRVRRWLMWSVGSPSIADGRN